MQAIADSQGMHVLSPNSLTFHDFFPLFQHILSIVCLIIDCGGKPASQQAGESSCSASPAAHRVRASLSSEQPGRVPIIRACNDT